MPTSTLNVTSLISGYETYAFPAELALTDLIPLRRSRQSRRFSPSLPPLQLSAFRLALGL